MNISGGCVAQCSEISVIIEFYSAPSLAIKIGGEDDCRFTGDFNDRRSKANILWICCTVSPHPENLKQKY